MEHARGRARPIKPLTQERLEKAALHYLERFASSAANLRRVLLRRVERAARLAGQDREEPTRWIEAIVARHVGSGLLNDRAYAEAASTSLRRQGRSARVIRQRLAAKGVDKEDVARALAASGGADETAEYRAGLAFARRRRLGPFAPPDQRPARRNRDLAALARAGFGYDIARRVVDARDEDIEA